MLYLEIFFYVKKKNCDLHCRICALFLHLQLLMSHSRCTQPINITKPSPLMPAGQNHITNLTLIFLFSLPASPQPAEMSQGGWKEHSEEPMVPVSYRRAKPRCGVSVPVIYQSDCLLGKTNAIFLTQGIVG